MGITVRESVRLAVTKPTPNNGVLPETKTLNAPMKSNHITTSLFKTLAVSTVAILGVTGAVSAQSNVNDAFIANEFPEPGAEINPFAGPEGGSITLGYSPTPSNPAAFTTANLVHTDAFNNNPQIEGFFINNNIIVPAVLVNTAATSLPLNFGGTILGQEILLHPGNPGPDGFVLPADAAVLRYTVASAGIYTISGVFRDIGGGPVAVDVLLNGTTILTAGAGSDATGFNETQTLAAGDFLDFVVDDANGIGSDSTGLYANIVIPEPGSIALLSFGALGLLARRRR